MYTTYKVNRLRRQLAKPVRRLTPEQRIIIIKAKYEE